MLKFYRRVHHGKQIPTKKIDKKLNVFFVKSYEQEFEAEFGIYAIHTSK